MKPRKIEPWQIKRIKGLVRDIGMDDIEYRMVMKSEFGVESCTMLTTGQASTFIQILSQDKVIRGD